MENLYWNANGTNIRYRMSGEGDAVVFIHGLGASLEYWEPNVVPLSKHFRVFTMDLPGFGQSDKTVADLTLDVIGRFVADFLDFHNLDRVTLVGNSMGGLVALQTAIQYPQRIHKLVLVDNAGFGRVVHWTFRITSLPIVGEVLYMLSPWLMPFVIRAMFHDVSLAPEGWNTFMIGMTRQPGARRTHLAALRYGVNLWGVKPEIIRAVREGIARLSMPTLICWGRQDQMLPMKQALNGLALIPGSQLHIWDRCGHVPQLEKPDEFNRLLLAFLSEP